MSMQPKDTDFDLRRAFPEVSLGMETQLLLHQANELGIRPRVNLRAKLPVFRVPLTLNHEISIAPVDRGALGIPEWFSFVRSNNHPKGQFDIVSRVHVTIENKRLTDAQKESFTIEAPDFEMMLRISLTIFYSVTGKKLQPVQKR
jgi:hypothetical protein